MLQQGLQGEEVCINVTNQMHWRPLVSIRALPQLGLCLAAHIWILKDPGCSLHNTKQKIVQIVFEVFQLLRLMFHWNLKTVYNLNQVLWKHKPKKVEWNPDLYGVRLSNQWSSAGILVRWMPIDISEENFTSIPIIGEYAKQVCFLSVAFFFL
jgi:hypothetical protein